MKLKTSVLPILCLFLLAFDFVSAQICFNGNFKPNSSFDLNRRPILSNLASNVTDNNGFYNSSMGQDPNRIFIIGMCIPGTKPETCSDCINSTSNLFLQNCPDQTVGYAWIEGCMVRYSNISFSGSLILEPAGERHHPGDINVDLTVFDRIWEELMLRTITAASNGSSLFKHKYYAAEIASLTTFQTMYAMMQCTPDVSSGDCEICLKESVGMYQSCCRGKDGGAVVRPFCFLRWGMNPFAGAFENVTLPPPPPPPTQSLPQPPLSLTPPSSDRANTTGKDVNSTGIVVAVLVTAGVILLLLIVGFAVYRRRKSYRTVEAQADDDITSPQSLQFDFKTIEAATDNFSENNKVGQGGFGNVYKGTLPNGTEVAVKRLSRNSGQGTQEFKNEVVLVAKLQHRNLVRLLGFCLEGYEQLLVYELVSNKSLDYFLFEPTKRQRLDWRTRYNIIGGIARGILYLHQDSRLTIIHRDLKASNILLDDDMNPKIADFGMARIFGMDQTRANTSKIAGTFGYMAPEYVMHGQFSMKSDVYSFGVLLLEIISGRMSSSFNQASESARNLGTHAWRLWRNGSALELLDSSFRENFQSDEVTRCIHIALLCVQEDPEDRPMMSTIILMLTSSTITLQVPRAPAFFFQHSRDQELFGKSISRSINDASITELEPR